jgi:hypothetical protein
VRKDNILAKSLAFLFINGPELETIQPTKDGNVK